MRTAKRTLVMLAAVAALAAAGRADEPSFSGKEPKWPEMEMLLKDRQVAKEIKLTGHKPWGQDAARNDVSIRAVYAKLKGR